MDSDFRDGFFFGAFVAAFIIFFLSFLKPTIIESSERLNPTLNVSFVPDGDTFRRDTIFIYRK